MSSGPFWVSFVPTTCTAAIGTDTPASANRGLPGVLKVNSDGTGNSNGSACSGIQPYDGACG